MARFVMLVELEVHDPAAFRLVAEQLIAIAEEEPGTLRYEWFESADGRTVQIIEEFVDEAAFGVHGGNIGDLIADASGLFDFAGTKVLGAVSAERRETMSARPTTAFFEPYGAFRP